MEIVFTSGEIEAPVKEYMPHPDVIRRMTVKKNRAAGRIFMFSLVVNIFSLNKHFKEFP